jgi:hypothetical protein
MIGGPAIFGWTAVMSLLAGGPTPADDPPTIRPFAPRTTTRSDAILGCVELSDGTVRAGRICLTRGARLKIYDETIRRQREIPLRVVRQIECKVGREWMEQEWRFRENASSEKSFTGRSYPARAYVHTITLQDGRTIVGPMSAIIYVQEQTGGKRLRFVLYKRQKGAVGDALESLTYVYKIQLGDEAFTEGKRRAGTRYRPATQRERE